MEQVDNGWRKSSYSGNGLNCVELGSTPGAILVRDTKDNGHGLVLRLTPGDWKRFAASITASRIACGRGTYAAITALD